MVFLINNNRVSNQLRQQEWPTWILIIATYSAWTAVLVFAARLHLGLVLLLLTAVMALFSSMSHEIIHGHPTKHQRLNDCFAALPVALYPYYEYKRSHLKHHINADLTRPEIDPESFFVTAQHWASLSPFGRAIKWTNMTLLGRLLLGPAHTIYGLAAKIMQDFQARSLTTKRQWLSYWIGSAAVLSIAYTANIPLWLYVLSAYFSLSVIALRSFYEHRPAANPTERTVIVESCIPLRFLYLYNNFHAVHHQYPTMAWYQIYAEFRLNRASYLARNGGFYFSGYRSWFNYLVTPVAHPVHPLIKVNNKVVCSVSTEGQE